MAPKQVSIGVQVELQAKASSMKKLYEDVSNLKVIRMDANIIDKVFAYYDDKFKFLDYIANWDGKINDIVPKTMAVINKQVWEVSNEERKR